MAKIIDKGVASTIRTLNVERRSTARVAVLETLAGIIAVDLDDSDNGIVLDLGPSGMMVQSITPLEVGSSRAVSFALPETHAYLRLPAVVVWSDHEGRAGLRFNPVQDGSLEKLREWLAQHIPDSIPAESFPAPLPETPNPPLRKSDAGVPATSPALSLVLSEDLLDLSSLFQSLNAEAQVTDAPVEFRHPHPGVAVPGPKSPASQRTSGALMLSPADKMAWEIAEQICRLPAVQGAVVAVADGSSITCHASQGNAPAVGAKLQPEQGLSGECFRTGKTVICNDAEIDPRVPAVVSQRLNLKSILVVPVLGAQASLGLLEALSSEKNAFTQEHVHVLLDLASGLARVLEARAQAGERARLSAAKLETPSSNPISGTLGKVEPTPESKPEPKVEPKLDSKAGPQPPPPRSAGHSNGARPGNTATPPAQGYPGSSVAGQGGISGPPSASTASASGSTEKLLPPSLPEDSSRAAAGNGHPAPNKNGASTAVPRPAVPKQGSTVGAKPPISRPQGNTEVPSARSRVESLPQPDEELVLPLAGSIAEPKSRERRQAPADSRSPHANDRPKPAEKPIGPPLAARVAAPATITASAPATRPAPVASAPSEPLPSSAFDVLIHHSPAKAEESAPLGQGFLLEDLSSGSAERKHRNVGIVAAVVMGVALVAGLWTYTRRPQPSRQPVARVMPPVPAPQIPVVGTDASTPSATAATPGAAGISAGSSATMQADAAKVKSSESGTRENTGEREEPRREAAESNSSSSPKKDVGSAESAAVHQNEVSQNEVSASAIRQPSSAPISSPSNPRSVQPPIIVIGNPNAPVNLPRANHDPRLAPQAAPRVPQPATVLQRIDPEFPPGAPVSGSVVLSSVIDQNGMPTNITVVSGNPVLARAAIVAFRKWRYRPAMLDGSAVPSTLEVRFNFKQP